MRLREEKEREICELPPRSDKPDQRGILLSLSAPIKAALSLPFLWPFVAAIGKLLAPLSRRPLTTIDEVSAVALVGLIPAKNIMPKKEDYEPHSENKLRF